MKAWFKIPLWQRVIGALILGVALGLFWGPEAASIKWIGDFFIKSIKMLVVPLIFFSLVAGVAGCHLNINQASSEYQKSIGDWKLVLTHSQLHSRVAHQHRRDGFYRRKERERQLERCKLHPREHCL